MPVDSSPLKTQPAGHRIRRLFIVARDQLDLWGYLRRDFAEDEEVQVIPDRRQWKRRHRVHSHDPERRREDRRRRKPSVDTDLRYRSFVILHEQQGVLSD